MKIVCLSDTHGYICPVPEADVLIFAGDMCNHGTLGEVNLFARWMATLPHRHKLIVAGNHDWPFERQPQLARAALDGIPGVAYLQDQEVVIDGVKFYGSPWQPEFCGWAFNVPRGPNLARIWARIPDDTDVLITHGPEFGVLDTNPYRQHVGCEELAARMAQLRLRLHVFGHIHGASGYVGDGHALTSVNACICDEEYEPVNAPTEVRLGLTPTPEIPMSPTPAPGA